MIDSFENTRCITACCIWGCVSAVRSECPGWPLFTSKWAYNGHVSFRTGLWSNGRKWCHLMNQVFLYIMWKATCVSVFTWGRDGTRVLYESQIHRRCNSQLTGLKGCAADMLVPDVKYQGTPSETFWNLCLGGLERFWWLRRTYAILVRLLCCFMFWIIGARLFTLRSMHLLKTTGKL